MLVLNSKLYKILLITISLFLIHAVTFSQEKNLNVSVQKGEYSFIVPLSMTLQQARDFGIQKAKINAIENAFGSVIMEGNTMYTVNKQTGTKIESNTSFNSISDVYVSGEWIEDVEPPSTIQKVIGNETWIITTVYGRVRELKRIPITFQSKTLVCPKIKCVTEQFKNNQDLYIHFKSPNNGYVTIYLDVPEETTTYRLLPYKSQRDIGSYEVKADKEYFLFYDSLKNNLIDEYTLTLSNGSENENNKLFIIFNPEKPIQKPLLSDVATMPLSIPSEDFQRWLQTLRKYNADLQVDYKYLSITK